MVSLFDLLLAFVVLITTSWFVFERIKYRNFPPGPWGLPLVGSIFSVRGEPHEWFVQLSKKFRSGIIFLRLGTVQVVVLNDWKCISKAFAEKDMEFSPRPSTLVWKIAAQSTGIAFGQGPYWTKEKNFNMKLIKARSSIIEEETAVQVQETIRRLEEKDGQKIEVLGLFFDPTFNVIVKFLTGKEKFSEAKTELMKANIRGAFQTGGMNYWMNSFPFLRHFLNYETHHPHIKCHKIVEDSITEDIDSQLENLDVEHPSTDNLIDVYLSKMKHHTSSNAEADRIFTMKALKATCTTYFYGGVETVEATLNFAFRFLAVWPEIQEKVRSEIDEVVGRSRSPTYSDHSLMPYTNATILEIHRVISVVPIAMPHSTYEETKFCGYTIPKDAVVAFNIWAVHNDRELWGDPEVFRPERFLDPEGNVVVPKYFLSFSKGVRVCPGKLLSDIEIFLMITGLLQRFSFHQITGEEPLTLEAVTGFTRNPKPFRLMVKLRQ